MRGFRRAGPLWGQLCKLWEETVLPEAASLMLGVVGGGVRATMSISRTLFCGLEATNLAPTSPRSWCPASSRGLPPPGGNSALLTPTALPEDAASCVWVTAWASVPYPRPFPVLSLGLRPSLSPATQLSEPPPPGSWLRFHLWEPHTLVTLPRGSHHETGGKEQDKHEIHKAGTQLLGCKRDHMEPAATKVA